MATSRVWSTRPLQKHSQTSFRRPPVAFVDRIRQQAAELKRRVVFPESGDERILAAAREMDRTGMAGPIPVTDNAALVATRAGGRFQSIPSGEDTALEYAHRMVARGEADACVAGAVYTTAEVLRSALRNIGLGPTVRVASSAFYMVLGAATETDEVLTFTDCAVIPYPTAENLADIAFAAAEDRRRIVGDEPRVALLSFSTHGSARGPSVEIVREALAIIRDRGPDFLVDGELQGDAALAPTVAAR